MSDEKKELGLTIGRPCCGSRTMCLSNNGKDTKTKFVVYREFKGWLCSVNWFFMHIEQQSLLVDFKIILNTMLKIVK